MGSIITVGHCFIGPIPKDTTLALSSEHYGSFTSSQTTKVTKPVHQVTPEAAKQINTLLAEADAATKQLEELKKTVDSLYKLVETIGTIARAKRYEAGKLALGESYC